MKRIPIVLLLSCSIVFAIALAVGADARQGIYEYFRAGTKRGRSSTLPQGHTSSRSGQSAAASSRAASAAPWTEAWFADSALVRRQLAAMTEAIAVPMIGETYPLPRGGGFVCRQPTAHDATSANGLSCVLECAGPELGGRRGNWFYSSASDPTPTLDRVRWSIHAPQSSSRLKWRAFYAALGDSLTRTMGRPVSTSADSLRFAWHGEGRGTTMQLHTSASHVDSLEIECVSDRLSPGSPRAAAP